MTNPLIVIASCARDTKNGFNNAIRNTWLQGVTNDYVFALGRDAISTHPDEIVLDCGDDYLNLPWKTHALLAWALNKGYDYVFKCDTDTYVKVDRLLQSDYANYDYIGYFNGSGPSGSMGVAKAIYEKCYSWASGGSGYWLSRNSANYIVVNPPDERSICPTLHYPCEDLWIGQLLGPKLTSNELLGKHDTRYWRGFHAHSKVDISAHYCSEGMNRKFDVEWMYRHHRINK